MRRNPRFPQRFPVDAAQSPRRRREPPVAERFRQEPAPIWARSRLGRGQVLAIALAAVVVVGGFGWWALGDGMGSHPRPVRPLPLPGLQGPSAPGAAMLPPPAYDPALAGADGAPSADAAGMALPAPGQQAVLPPSGEDAVLAASPQADVTSGLGPAPKRTASPVLVFDAGDARTTTGSGGEPQLVIASNPVPATARPVPSGDRKGVVTRGTLIPAVLESTIDSSTPGTVRAVVTADVRSFDGAKVLIPKSSRLVGQYRGGDGGRAYVIWTRVDQPGGRAVKVGSAPGAGGGKVDGAFLESFGAARLQSVVSGAGGTGVRVRQGEPIRVYAANDLDVGGKGK